MNWEQQLKQIKANLTKSCQGIVKLDSNDILLERILEKEMPEYYIEITKKELLSRIKN